MNPVIQQKMEAQYAGAAGFAIMQSAGYTGSNDRVANAFNHMLAPEIAVAGLQTQISGAFQTAGFGGQNVAAAAGFNTGTRQI